METMNTDELSEKDILALKKLSRRGEPLSKTIKRIALKEAQATREREEEKRRRAIEAEKNRIGRMLDKQTLHPEEVVYLLNYTRTTSEEVTLDNLHRALGTNGNIMVAGYEYVKEIMFRRITKRETDEKDKQNKDK